MWSIGIAIGVGSELAKGLEEGIQLRSPGLGVETVRL